MIIAFANHKGGVGKTTLALITAETLLDNGASVTMYDLDGQQNFTDEMRLWIKGMDDKLDIVTFSKLHNKTQNEKGKYIIIDTAPGLGTDSEKAIEIADVVVVPVETAISSLKGFNDIVNLKSKPKIILVTNKFDKSSAFAKDFLKEIEKIAKTYGERVKMHTINRSRQLVSNVDNGDYWAFRMTDKTAEPFMKFIEATIQED